MDNNLPNEAFVKGIVFREFDQIAETFLDLELNKRECQLQGM